MGSILRISRLVHQVRTHQMQDNQIMLLILLLQTVVLLQHALVIRIKTGVTCIKQLFAQIRIVQEETSAEVVNSLVSLRLELVGDKRNVIACLAEYFWEEWFIAPFLFFADGLQRQDVLEHKTGKIPGSRILL